VSLRLAAGDWAAEFLPDRGLLGLSLTFRGRELLHQRGGLGTWKVGGSTMALPLLAPWANRLSQWTYEGDGVPVDLRGAPVVKVDEHGLPIHGTMIAQPGWEVVRADASSFTARFAYDREDLLSAFPFPHDLEVDVVLDGGLRLETAIVARDRPVPVSFGWHPYFRIDRSSDVLGLPERSAVELDDRGIPTGREDPLPAEVGPLDDRVLDSHFALGSERRFTLRDLQLVYEEGYPFAQVFAPAGSEFVAIEPMTAKVNALVDGGAPLVEPGGRFAARFSLS
jgi:galactose mutarotase-like enzyme